MKYSEKRDKIFKALTTFRKQVVQPSKSADNPFFKSKYVTLDGVIKAIDDGTLETGLAFVQNVYSAPDDKGIFVQTIITHESDQFIEFDPLFIPADKQNAQGYGSATTYAKRYSLSAAFGIAADIDDDGNAASQQKTTQQRQAKQPRQQAVSHATSEQIKKLETLATKYCGLKDVPAEKHGEIESYALKKGGAVSVKTATSSQMERAISWLSKEVTSLLNQQKSDTSLNLDSDGNPV